MNILSALNSSIYMQILGMSRRISEFIADITGNQITFSLKTLCTFALSTSFARLSTSLLSYSDIMVQSVVVCYLSIHIKPLDFSPGTYAHSPCF